MKSLPTGRQARIRESTMNGSIHNFIDYTKAAFRGLKLLSAFRLSYIRKVFSLMGKREKTILFALGSLAILSLFFSIRNFYIAHTKLVPTVGGIYVEGMAGQPMYINPLLAHQEIDDSLVKLIYSGLYKYDTQGNLVPDLADGMPVIDPDQKQYTISLKKNVKWHNDKTFTADDVVFTIQTLQDPVYKSPLRNLWLSTTVEKLGEYQVKFTTKDIFGPFLEHLTLPILPKSIWEKIDSSSFVLSASNLDAIGTGPYLIKEKKKLNSGKIQELTLSSFSNYYSSKPKVDTIIIKFYDTDEDMVNAFHSNEIKAFGFVPLDRNVFDGQKDDNTQLLNIPIPQYQALFFNVKNKVLSDPSARQALAYATDRSAIIEQVFKNNARIPTATGSAGSEIFLPENLYMLDKDKAVATLENGGWKIDPATNIRSKKNIPFEITIATNDSLINSKSAELIAAQWRNLNIKVTITVIPTKQLTDTLIRPRTFDVLLFPQKLSADADPFIFWHSSQAKDPGLNISGFADGIADKLITESRSTTDQNIRKKKLAEFHTILAQQVPVLYLSQTTYLYAVDSEVQNIHLGTLYEPSQRFYDTPNWYMEEKREWK